MAAASWRRTKPMVLSGQVAPALTHRGGAAARRRGGAAARRRGEAA